MERIERIGQTVSSCFGVRGIFGVDLILKDNDPWPIEVNPRYTASVEALEWATGRSFLGEHARAFGFEPPVFGGNLRAEGFVGKAIVHATRAFSWTERVDDDFKPALMPEIADIPAEGTVFAPGDPVMTVLARGDSPRECRKSLGARILDWRRRLSIVPG
jgi:predicted ATP-grasp superfamily ATP-dependent carboligase